MSSTIHDSRHQTELDIARDGVATRVVLQPIAAPSVLGLFGFAGATFIVASNMAGWWGTPDSGLALAPFAAMFGGSRSSSPGCGLPRAGRDRDRDARHVGRVLARVRHLEHHGRCGGADGADAVVPQPGARVLFFALAAITTSGFLASLFESLSLAGVLGTLAAGSGIAAGAFIYGSHGWVEVAGWVFVISAGLAWYTATAMMLAAAGGRTMLPLFKWKKAANVPGRRPVRPIELEWAEPGVKLGQ
jgi:succinate-acetate transporter protein